MQSAWTLVALLWVLCMTRAYDVSLRQPCYDDDECPPRAICRPRSCEMFVCQCQPGYFRFNVHSDMCTKAPLVGQNCSINSICLPTNSVCNVTSGVCECLADHTPSRDGFKCTDDNFSTPPNLDDNCTTIADCDFFSTCTNGSCLCKPGFSRWTWEEKWLLYPRPNFLSCKTPHLAIDMCDDNKVSMPHVPNHKPRPTYPPTSTPVSMDTPEPEMKPLLPPHAVPRFVPPPPKYP